MMSTLARYGPGAFPGGPIEAPLTHRIAALAYGLFCYAVFFATFLYAAGWIIGVGTPTKLDGPRTGPLWLALVIDIALLALFSVQHSVMARPAFKRAWTKIIPKVAERPTYVLFSSLALIAMFILWQPIGGVVWDVQGPVARGILYGAFAFGMLLVLYSTFLINHFDLFGVRQVWMYFTKREGASLRFATPGAYRLVRHPLYVGWIVSFWATPTMTGAHLLFAVLTTAYILIAIQFEERDLMAHHAEYAEYRRTTGMLTPRVRRPAPEPASA